MNIEEIDANINSLLYNVEIAESSNPSSDVIQEEEEEHIQILLESVLEPEEPSSSPHLVYKTIEHLINR